MLAPPLDTSDNPRFLHTFTSPTQPLRLSHTVKMAPPRKYNVKLKIAKTYLETLPVFAPPKPKSRAKKVSLDEKKSAASPRSSPAPADDFAISKVNTGPKELSTAGLTINSAPQALDKSGRPCRKWTKKVSEFKTFSGFKVGVDMWRPGPKPAFNLEKKPVAALEAVKMEGVDIGTGTPSGVQQTVPAVAV